jgi:hypothetical protein
MEGDHAVVTVDEEPEERVAGGVDHLTKVSGPRMSGGIR